MTDHTPDSTLQEDLVEDAEADKMNDPYGLLGQTVYDVVNETKLTTDSLTWDGMVQVLKEEKDLVQSARDYQTRVNQYYTLNPESPTYYNNYQTWLGRTIDEMQRHRELLAQKLGKKVALDSSEHKFIAKITPSLGLAAGGGTGWLVGTASFDIAVVGFMTGAIVGLTAVLGVNILGNLLQKRIESRAVGRYRTSFNKSIQIRPDEELLR